jgi:hypothetical protein
MIAIPLHDFHCTALHYVASHHLVCCTVLYDPLYCIAFYHVVIFMLCCVVCYAVCCGNAFKKNEILL